jgi:hypothetical protein
VPSDSGVGINARPAQCSGIKRMTGSRIAALR